MSLLFLHIEKCGGMSLRKIIYELFKNEYKNEFFIQNYDGTHTEQKYDINYVITKKIIEWHEFYDNLLNVYDLKITCLRNPVLRLISHYHYFDKVKYGYESLIEFENQNETLFKNYALSLGNLQILKISGYTGLNLNDEILEKILIQSIQNIQTYFYVLQLETLNEDLTKMRKKIKKTKKFKKLNKLKLFNENKTVEKYMTFYDFDVIKKYSNYCKYDIQLYNFVCDFKKITLK